MQRDGQLDHTEVRAEVPGSRCATTSPATTSGHDHADAPVGTSVDNYLRAHPGYGRRLRAQLVWADIDWLPTQRG
jgi:hypothetical protein